MPKKLILMFSILLVVAIGALAADISGKWTAQVPGRGGQSREATFTFKVKGVTAGTYRLDVRPVVAAVGPMRDQGVYTEVTVR